MYQLPNIDTLTNISEWKRDIFADYSGSDRKTGLISPDKTRYLIKYAESHTRKNDLDTSYVNNILNEHLSSRILGIIGYPVHDTFLATYKDELVVCCKNFTSEQEKLIEFGQFLKAHYDSGELGRIPDLQQMKYVLESDELLIPHKEELWQTYWDRFIGDALTGNFDRHMGNFGVLISETNLVPSPIYDNGSTLFPALTETKMREILDSRKEVLKRTWLFPKAALTVHGQKVSYEDMLSSGYIPELSKAVRIRVPIIEKRLPDIHAFLQNEPYLSDIRKEFYSKMIQVRFEFLLKPAYEKCITRTYDKDARSRLENGINYTEQMFETRINRFLRQ